MEVVVIMLNEGIERINGSPLLNFWCLSNSISIQDCKIPAKKAKMIERMFQEILRNGIARNNTMQQQMAQAL